MTNWKSSLQRSRNLSNELPLPPGFMAIRDVLNGKRQGNWFSVIGLVTDYMRPTPTRGTDFKCHMRIYDKSTEDGAQLAVDFFRPENEMPQPGINQPNAGDVVVLWNVGAQLRKGEISLISRDVSVIHIYAATKIPKPPKSAREALLPPVGPKGWSKSGPTLPFTYLPSGKEEGREYMQKYVSWLRHDINKDALPTAAEFLVQLEYSNPTKDKFKLLKDVEDLMFLDMTVQAVKDPIQVDLERTTLWVTDFTENEGFQHFSWNGNDMSDGREGDPYGYTSYGMREADEWPGPFGKRCLQITCFGEHGNCAQKHVKAGDWVRLKNIQIKYGRNGNYLEGFLREDQVFGYKVRVEVLDHTDRENVDDRLKQAIRRKLEYEKSRKQQMKAHAANENGKRPAEVQQPAKMNSKKRRKLQREKLEREEAQKEAQKKEQLNMNGHIKCENPGKDVSTLSTILEREQRTIEIDGQEFQYNLPFTNIKSLANVRVVDFRPQKLEDFVKWEKSTEYEVLSDYSESDSSDEDDGTLNRFAGNKTWEWSFSLQLEEAGEKPAKNEKPERVWVVVNNDQAQQLLGLDASNLRENPEELASLREQLFTLWGNLEELKQNEIKQQQKARKRLVDHEPPPDSSDNEMPNDNGMRSGRGETPVGLSNKPFTCCIMQYGVKIDEPDSSKADAGEGQRWERVFALYGTKICQ